MLTSVLIAPLAVADGRRRKAWSWLLALSAAALLAGCIMQGFEEEGAVGDNQPALTSDGLLDPIYQEPDTGMYMVNALYSQRTGGFDIYKPVGSKWTLREVGDLNGDGTDDILWQRRDGQVHYWPMENGRRTGGFDIHRPVGTKWPLREVGDLNGDGTDDILWQRRDGQVHYWSM